LSITRVGRENNHKYLDDKGAHQICYTILNCTAYSKGQGNGREHGNEKKSRKDPYKLNWIDTDLSIILNKLN
jgi:hypothetical protein